MTTQLRNVSQIPALVKYVFAVGSTNAWVPNTTTKVSTLLPYSEFSSKFTPITAINADEIMRDMGKSIMLLTPQGNHYALLRLVQLVDGPVTEGVPDNWDTNGQFYVCTWSADPTTINVTITRTG
jgi:hypothetical protein